VAVACGAILVGGCGGKQDQATRDARRSEADKQVRQKYGKGLDELETLQLVILSPHNTDIENEYEEAFSLHHAVEHGKNVDVVWRDVGGGSSSILTYLRNIYANGETSEIDVTWGGGPDNFNLMADEGILQPMTIPPDALANIPATLDGAELYDPQHRWCGSVVSGFGFLYNKPLLDRLKRQPPKLWDDLGDSRFGDLVGLADPTQSGSAATSYEMIVQSAHDWPAGWAKLLGILGNVKKFYAGAGDAADAVPSGEVAVSTCVDFYGSLRAVKYPGIIVYVSPEGQTSFNPDPIAILKNPPHPELARRFVDFVLSLEGQALWALPVGSAGGPARAYLGRQPIRRDFYEKYAGQTLPSIVDPYAAGRGMKIDEQLWSASSDLLKRLVWAAAVENREGLQAAKKKLLDNPNDEQLKAAFAALPDNVSSRDKLEGVSEQLRDAKQAEIIVTGWVDFFRDKYARMTR
jgi:ABC-type Fe3+ transport system substrate-binding protein